MTTSKILVASALAIAGMTLLAGNASALSLSVKLACASDYYAHCSAYSPDSPQTRSCMRAVGNHLSSGCVAALVGAGEVSSAEVNRRRLAMQAK